MPTGVGHIFAKLLVFMVLTSAAASTQTTILPTARTSLSMAAYRAIPGAFAKIHPRYLTPSVSTLTMGGVSIVLYVVFNFVAAGNIIADSVTGAGLDDCVLLRPDRLHLRLVLPAGRCGTASATCGCKGILPDSVA